MSTKTILEKGSRDRYVIIMAGGKGERFWPVSREKTPKQLITILGRKSFLQQAVERVLPVVPIKNILVITNAVQAPQVRRQLPRLPRENVIAEPMGRDTCAAVALGAALVGARSSAAVMAVLPADHVIPEEKKFQQVLSDAFDLAVREPLIVTIGIKPNEPSTGYGYIEVGERLPPAAGTRSPKTHFFQAARFVEKPNQEKAIEYLESGKYRWNAGMFIWSYTTISEGLRKHQKEIAEAGERWREAAAKNRLTRVLARDYPNIRKISIDFALLEKAENVAVAAGDFGWDDLGSWTALARHVKADANGNSALANLVEVDAAGNIVFDGRKKKKPIALVGVRDSIVVQTDDATLVAAKSEAQGIKELVKKLASDKRYRKLV